MFPTLGVSCNVDALLLVFDFDDEAMASSRTWLRSFVDGEVDEGNVFLPLEAEEEEVSLACKTTGRCERPRAVIDKDG